MYILIGGIGLAEWVGIEEEDRMEKNDWARGK